jgi:hypothetical protein
MGRGKSSRTAARDHRSQTKAERLLSLLPTEGEGFRFYRHNGLLLVSPGKAWISLEHWQGDRRWFRSCLIDEEEGRIVSLGFPKFHNLYEDPITTAAFERALETGDEIWFTQKIDGTLVIRSVVRGEVIFRTRGTIDGGEYGSDIRRIVEKRYPLLLDPEFEPESSLLFEFVSPHYRIVILYPQEDLIFLGAVNHRTLTLAKENELRALAAEAGLNLVPSHSLPRSLKELHDEVSSWDIDEGVVCRFADGQEMIKVKSASYLARHRLRFSLTPRSVRETCESLDIRSLDQFEEYLRESGGDWELAREAKPMVEAYLRAIDEAYRTCAALRSEVQEKREAYPVRKDFALEYALALPPHFRAAAFSFYDQDADSAFGVIKRFELEKAFEAFDRPEDEPLSREE